MRRILLIALLSVGLDACASDCLKLAQRICDCQPTATQRDTCNTEASSQKSLINLTAADEAACSAALDSCDCRQLNTPEGKVACAQARAP
jgi:hypothetical protein